jgi:hypothetical protein
MATLSNARRPDLTRAPHDQPRRHDVLRDREVFSNDPAEQDLGSEPPESARVLRHDRDRWL